MIIKKIKPLSAAKIFGILNAIIGLVVGIVFMALALGGYKVETQTGPIPLPGGFGILSIFVLPVLYGGAGFFSGFVCGCLYNLIAAFCGGLEIETQQ